MAPLFESDAPVSSSAQSDSRARSTSPGPDAAAAGSDPATSGRKSPLVEPLPDGVREIDLEIGDSQGSWVTLKALYDHRLNRNVIREGFLQHLGFESEYLGVPMQIVTPRGVWKITGFAFLHIRDRYHGASSTIIYRFSVSPDIPKTYDLYLGSEFFEWLDRPPSLTSDLLDGGSSTLQALPDKTLEDSSRIGNVQTVDGDRESDPEDQIDYVLWLLPETPGSLDSTSRRIAVSALCTESLITSNLVDKSYRVHKLEQPKTIYKPPYFAEPYQATRYVALKVVHWDRIYLSPEAAELLKRNNVVKPSAPGGDIAL
ncbi:hypothetical protein V8F33_001459 [Rhypophila sp. PSN 637]